APGAVVVADLLDPRPILVARDEPQRDRLGLFGGEALLGERHELAVDARPENVPGLDVQVGGPAIDSGRDDPFHAVSTWLPGPRRSRGAPLQDSAGCCPR